MIFTLLFERFRWRTIVRSYGLNFRRWKLRKSILWAVAFYVVFTLLYVIAILVLGNGSKLPGLGHIILSSKEFFKVVGIENLLFTNQLSVLYFVSFLNSIFVGLTLNAFFAFGEELGWRGYLWQQLNQIESLNPIQRNGILGIVWGLWHAPLILQGYNFPGQPIAGILYMVVACIVLNLILTDFTDRYNTVIVASLIHGMINATGYLSVIVYGSSAPVGSVLGLISLLSMMAAWKIVRQLRDRSSVTTS